MRLLINKDIKLSAEVTEETLNFLKDHSVYIRTINSRKFVVDQKICLEEQEMMKIFDLLEYETGYDFAVDACTVRYDLSGVTFVYA